MVTRELIIFIKRKIKTIKIEVKNCLGLRYWRIIRSKNVAFLATIQNCENKENNFRVGIMTNAVLILTENRS